MKLSIIIPVYNEENTIKKLIHKVINNNYENKEIIIIDDCSSDKSLEIINNFLDDCLAISDTTSDTSSLVSVFDIL